MQTLNTYTYDELFIGMEDSIVKKLSKSIINKFSVLSGDFHPLHNDDSYAKENKFNGIIAHGMLISSFASALIGMQLPGRNMILLSQCFDYLQPVYVGDQIIITGTVKRKIDPLKIIIVSISIKSNFKEIVAKGEMKIKLLK